MPECQKIYPNSIWQVSPEWHGLNVDSVLLTKVYWSYATHNVRVCISSKSPINPDILFTRKVIFKLILALKQWLVCTTFSSIILLHLRIHSSKKYFHIFLPVFTLRTSITLLTNTPRMMNQSILLTHQILHFFLMIGRFYLRYPLNIFLYIFPKSKKFYHTDGRKTKKTVTA